MWSKNLKKLPSSTDKKVLVSHWSIILTRRWKYLYYVMLVIIYFCSIPSPISNFECFGRSWWKFDYYFTCSRWFMSLPVLLQVWLMICVLYRLDRMCSLIFCSHSKHVHGFFIYCTWIKNEVWLVNKTFLEWLRHLLKKVILS